MTDLTDRPNGQRNFNPNQMVMTDLTDQRAKGPKGQRAKGQKANGQRPKGQRPKAKGPTAKLAARDATLAALTFADTIELLANGRK